jgi:HEAT repeat protein/S1-C subfamily serine protease
VLFGRPPALPTVPAAPGNQFAQAGPPPAPEKPRTTEKTGKAQDTHRGEAHELEGGKKPADKPKDDDDPALPAEFEPPKPLSPEEVYKQLFKSVVWIERRERVPVGGGAVVEAPSTGTGEVIDRDQRLVLTNHHVAPEAEVLILFPKKDVGGKISSNPDDYTYTKVITLPNGRKVPITYFKETLAVKGRVLGSDPRRDLSLIKLEALPPDAEVVSLPLARESPARGQSVYTIGGKPTAALGVWETKQGSVTNERIPLRSGDNAFLCVQTDLRINHGNSGGPMVNNRCLLVGVNQSISGAGAAVDKDRQVETTNIASNHIDVSEVLPFVQGIVGRQWQGAEPPPPDEGPSDKLDALIAVLEKSKVAAKRKVAAERLGRLGPSARRAVVKLLERVRDVNKEAADVRAEAAAALTKIGPPDKKDVPALIDALRDDAAPEARRYAAAALGKMGDAARPAVDDLVRACGDTDAEVRAGAATALGVLGDEFRDKTYARLLDLLKDGEKPVRKAAWDALAKLGKPPDAEPLKALLATAKYPEARAYAIIGLSYLGPGSAPALVKALAEDKDAEVAGLAAFALGTLKVRTPEVCAALTGALDREEKLVKLEAVQALARLGGDPAVGVDPLVLPGLIKALSSDDDDVFKWARLALPPVTSFMRNSATVPVTTDDLSGLKELLKNKRPVARCFAALALGSLGKEAAPALPELLDALRREKTTSRDNSPWVRLELLAALAAIGPPAQTALGNDAERVLAELRRMVEKPEAVAGAPEVPTPNSVFWTYTGWGRSLITIVDPGKPQKPRDDALEITQLLPRAAAVALVTIAPDGPDAKGTRTELLSALRLRDPDDPYAPEKKLHDLAKNALVDAGKKAAGSANGKFANDVAAAIVRHCRRAFSSDGVIGEPSAVVREKYYARLATYDVLKRIGPPARCPEVDSLLKQKDNKLAEQAERSAAGEAWNAIYK